MSSKSRAATPTVELLEVRAAPSAAPWLLESFDTTAVGKLPSGWAQWASSPAAAAAVSSAQAFSAPNNLALTAGSSNTSARAWFNTPLPSADAQVSANIFLGTLIPAEVLARGSNLGTTTPSFYALAVSRGMQVQVVRVVNGVTTALGQVASTGYFSQCWVQATLSVVGTSVQVQIVRPDTGQYLNGSGQWQTAQAGALTVTDTGLSGAGLAGVALPPSYNGTVSFDNFSIALPTASQTTTTTTTQPATTTESFDGTAAGSLPAGWSQWNSAGGPAFGVSSALALSKPNGLAATVAASSQSARAWLTSAQLGDAQVTAAVYLNSLIPAQVLARGSNLNTASPTYYAAVVTRGVQVQMVRVVNGVATVLGQLTSTGWLSGQWARVTLAVTGTTLQVQVVRVDTGQYLAPSGAWQSAQAWSLTVTDSAVSGPGLVGLGQAASYSGTVAFDDFSVQAPAGVTLPPPPPTTTQPSVGQDYSWIRLAELAYTGTPFGTQETAILQNSVNLVITTNTQTSAQIHALAPNVTQLIYTNLSTVYLDLLTSWLTYADANGLSREEAFYHVSVPTSFSGGSSSSQPVNWFWGVYLGGTTFTDDTAAAHGTGSGSVAFGSAGQSLYVGYTDPYREIDLALASGAANGWSGVWEYPTAVDSSGNPTTWATLPTLANTTAGLTKSGQVLFDPPTGWKTASINGSARLYYVRFRTTTGGTAPVASSILGADYVNAHGTDSGVIPVFDYAADTNHDGYLNDQEYAVAVQAGDYARFAYQGRDFASYYGQMRFATNPGDAGFRAWAIAYETNYLNGFPYASGLFVDNSGGVPLVTGSGVRESVATYASDYGSLLKALDQALAPRWLIGNTSAGGSQADPVVAQIPGYFEEFAIRPLSDSYQQFEALAAQTAHRATLQTPSPYAILDSLPTGGSPTDPRTEMATLAYYYLLADPHSTFLDFYGGYAPGTSWTQHYTAAVTYNVGQPLGTWSVLATGADPSNTALTYKVYQRSYGNALVLYKPLSYGSGVTGTTADATATTISLGGTYYILQNDGTLGPAVTSVTLRNGEGAILIKK